MPDPDMDFLFVYILRSLSTTRGFWGIKRGCWVI